MQMKTIWFFDESIGSFLGVFLLYFRALRHALMDHFKKIWGSFFNSRGCLGCCSKATPIIAVDAPSKGLKVQGRTVRKPSLSEDFWSSSTYEMENSGVQSQRSVSSISTSNQTLDSHGAGNSSNPCEFVNHGLLLWTQTRQQWIGNKRKENQVQQVLEPRLRVKPERRPERN